MKVKFTLVLSLMTFFIYAQKQGNGGIPKSFKYEQIYKNIDQRTFSTPDLALLRAEDALVDNTGTAPWRFGYNNFSTLNLSNSGSWFDLENGDRIWFLKLSCEQALSINLTFKNTEIPQGNELYVFNEKRDFILGKFMQEHIYNGQLGTELVPGNTVIVEYYLS